MSICQNIDNFLKFTFIAPKTVLDMQKKKKMHHNFLKSFFADGYFPVKMEILNTLNFSLIGQIWNQALSLDDWDVPTLKHGNNES